ncbi:MAG: peptidylprolyl isomerase [Pseudomonadota bacterium]
MKTLLILLVTTFGNVAVEVYPDKAPKSADNFVQYVKDGHYDGTQFHRVIDGFMIQGGGFDASMQQKPTRSPVVNEAGNGLRNERGTLAMARTSDPHSATAQFFINTVDNRFLDRDQAQDGHGYTVFGRVVYGMDVVDRIEKVRTGIKPVQGYPARDVPLSPVLITEARIIKSLDEAKPAAPSAAKK